MRNAWFLGLLIFCLAASGFILVRGRAPGQAGDLAASLADHAEAAVQGAATRLGGEDEPADEPAEERPPATFYRYTDATGTVRFVSSLAEVPKALRDSARPVSNDRVQRAPASAAVRPRGERLQEQAYERAMEHEVVVYTTSWCGWCRKTLGFLEKEGVAFENRDIEADETWREELIEKTGSTSIPVVEIDGEIIHGYDPKRMAQLLRSS
jgi:glutaredoxin-like YruB-family protein